MWGRGGWQNHFNIGVMYNENKMDLGNESKMDLGNKNKMDGIESKLMPVSSFQSYLRPVPDDSELINKVSRSADTQLTGDSKKRRGDDGDGGMKDGGGKPRSSRKRASKTRNLRRKSTKRQSRHRGRTSRK
jgi:hypothetical protein